MKNICLLIAIVLLSNAGREVTAQSGFPLPKEMKNAYQGGTRSFDGYPGPNYWQNGSRYVIHAQLDAASKKLAGEESVTYFNNSPDTLNRIVIRLYQDLFKVGNAKDFSLGKSALNEGTVIDYLKINGNPVDIDDRKSVGRTATNLVVKLPGPLMPGDSLLLETSWQFQIPSERPIRMGYYGRDLFFIAYWYPQIAVYDDIDGWDMLDYKGMVEFYNDFNTYDVYMTLPDQYLMWATGSLLNENELFTGRVIKNLEKAHNSDEIIDIITVADCRKGKVLKPNNNTWHFKASNVTDFSFATSRIMNWKGSSVVVDSTSGRKVFVDAVYADSARTFDTAALWARNSVKYMSYVMPAYPYPYEHSTVFSNGSRGGGMETPMMVNNGDPKNPASSAGTVFHEIAHTYFPFFMGINERKYAWMDEGWAAYLTSGFYDIYYPKRHYTERGAGYFNNFNGSEREATLMTLSYMVGAYDSYRNHAYNRSSLAYHFLRDALGDSLFTSALHEYLNRWNGKHPLPYDFFNTFNNATGRNLGWFFIPWFFEKAQADLGIKKVTLDNKVVVENVGGLPLPVALSVFYQDGSQDDYYRNTSVWNTSDRAIVVETDAAKKIKKIELGNERIPDIDRSNNELVIAGE